MIDANFVTSPYVNPIPTAYGDNLGRAARGFVAALFAMDPPGPHEETADVAEGVEELSNLANQFDGIMPNQAAELRYLAGTSEESEGE